MQTDWAKDLNSSAHLSSERGGCRIADSHIAAK